MKRMYQYLMLVVLLSNFSCGEANSAKKNTPQSNFAEIKFESEKMDIGVTDGKTNANQDFKFKNTGGIPLVITEVKGSCHCVQGKWSGTPIEPGDSSIISVSFDPVGVSGLFIRTLTVHSNATRPAVELTLSGDIKRDPKDTTASKSQH